MDSKVVLFCLLAKLNLIGIFAYDNVALRKLTWQQFPYTDRPLNNITMAEKAVDGLYSDRSAFGGQCTISANKRFTATWRVDLGGVLSIHHIRIYYRTDNNPWDISNGYTSRFLGFSVYISNTSNKYDGYLCFKDTNYTRYTIPDNVTKECVKHGRYIIYYNKRPRLAVNREGYSRYAYSELCELEVYGCSTRGFYGEDCDLPCPENCQERRCDIVNGTCLECRPGYKGKQCEEQCDNYKYGLECSKSCGNCSNGEPCYHVNGSCTNGCDAGVQGYRCDEKCPEGRYGKNCQDACSINCGVPSRCDRVTGECHGGCQAGWKDIGCYKKCPEGTYSFNCQYTCSINCGVPGRCDRVTGECQGGCQEGWKGTRCDRKCDDDKFGLQCAQSCGVCLNKEQCHHINGTCLNGCDKGYQGINCNEECPWGFHGYSCNKTCSNDCFNRSCNAVTGACPVETKTFPIIGGTAAITVVSLAVVILCFIFRRKLIRKYTRGTAKYQNNSEKKAEKLSSENTTPNKDIYGEKGTYQELGPRTEGSDNGGYQKLGHRVEGSDNGEYQELGPRTGVSDNGDYQELEPGMESYDKTKDNTEYQELGQISEHFYYEKLH
ncbi:cell death abnormality protein 1-like [Saccostrea cucullata]|uniref:cell death abnormality protein 1-like n=1 Tax=Saccostrea cuccullata TaxID=36930 RepID=UPI002ED25342